MAIKRHFFPNGTDDSIPWRTLFPGEQDAFRDFSSGSLGRLVMTECSRADDGGAISLFVSETKVVEASELVIPVIEIAEAEGIITLDEGDECELPIKSMLYGTGTLLFRQEPSEYLKQLEI